MPREVCENKENLASAPSGAVHGWTSVPVAMNGEKGPRAVALVALLQSLIYLRFIRKRDYLFIENSISILRQSLFYMTHHISIVLGKGPRLFGILILETDLIT